MQEVFSQTLGLDASLDEGFGGDDLMNFHVTEPKDTVADLMSRGPADGFERIRANRAQAMRMFKTVKSRMRNTNSWDHYEWLANFLNVYAREHRAYTRILIKNGVN